MISSDLLPFVLLFIVCAIPQVHCIRFGQTIYHRTTDVKPIIALILDMDPEHDIRLATGVLIHPRFFITAYNPGRW